MADRRHSARPDAETAGRAQPARRTGGAPAPPLQLRVVIERVRPQIDGGRFPIKRTPGEAVRVTADIFADGHDEIVAMLRDRPVMSTAENAERAESSWPDEAAPSSSIRSAESASAAVGLNLNWRETPMTLVDKGNDEWGASFDVGRVGWHEYAVVAWVDRFRTWRRDLRIKAAAGQDVALELLEGALMVREAADRAMEIGAGVADSHALLRHADRLSDTVALDIRLAAALADELAELMLRYADRREASMSPTLRVRVDRERARFGAWYEMFPRSAGPDPARSGTFEEAAALLPAIADLGFDIIYLPPIHPIGRSFRKGANNRLTAGPDDPGSPWAIGSAEGGHTAVEPGLGTIDDFDRFRAEADRLGMEVALDLAWQASPDHPWVREHPEWFRHRPDGTIRYAENPPKKYQDIYPLDFACEDWPALWSELLEVTLFWVRHGVRVFRVDNPHTKSFGFWEWLIGRVQAYDPEVLFLSEAFTRPKPMRFLAKAGFTQSYTYFTWRNSKEELIEYFTELATSEAREYFRPNLFTNTPDILHEYLQTGGRAAFEARLLLATTLGASYGIYSGFELCEGSAVSGTEEYLDSEKYQFRKWDWNRPGHIKELVRLLNSIRRQHPALQFDHTLRFHATDNPRIIAYSKSIGGEVVYTVVNLDPHSMQHGFVQVPLDLIGAHGPDATFEARDLLDDVVYAWRGEWNYVRLDPGVRQGHVLKLRSIGIRN
jgi:starch synthase (maltosyl-transferring)